MQVVKLKKICSFSRGSLSKQRTENERWFFPVSRCLLSRGFGWNGKGHAPSSSVRKLIWKTFSVNYATVSPTMFSILSLPSNLRTVTRIDSIEDFAAHFNLRNLSVLGLPSLSLNNGLLQNVAYIQLHKSMWFDHKISKHWSILSSLFFFFSQGYAGNLRKYSASSIDSLGTAYDYGSVMHYGG